LNITDRTLRRWCRGEVLARMLGRPVRRSSLEARNGVIHFLDEHGPHLGVPTLRECFPAMSRAELSDLLVRYRRVWRKRNRVPLRVLHWSVVGSVWAIDFSGPRLAVEGHYRYLLAVRDLASGYQLLWQPVESATAEVALDALKTLFAEHGMPLVIKCDNGSAFISAVVSELLAKRDVMVLFSPPHLPRYNGAIEAGIGSLKARTDTQAARSGHAGQWSWDDVAVARCEANAWSRPCGPEGPSPDELWASRMPITGEERVAFVTAVEACRRAEENASRSCAGGTQEVRSEREMARHTIRLALEQRGYLHYTRRSIPPLIKRQ
jgi:transposase InsO family protein